MADSEKPIHFVEFRTDLPVRETDELRSYILVKDDYPTFSAACIIYHDDLENDGSKEGQNVLKLNYWIVVVKTGTQLDETGTKFQDALAKIKEKIECKENGLPKLFDNVSEKCYKGLCSTRRKIFLS